MELNYWAARGLQTALNETIDRLEGRLKAPIDRDKLPPKSAAYFAAEDEELREALQQLKQLIRAADKTTWAVVIERAKGEKEATDGR